jgi:small subunit ribosomal protein S16
MLIIRFKPMGRKHAKHYRISVSQKTKHVSKLSHEDLGWYNPYTKESKINAERLNYYLALNIEISPSVSSLFQKLGLIPKIEKKYTVKEKAPKKAAK